MIKHYPQSKVEIDGFTSRYHDSLLNIASLGRYPAFIKRSIGLMKINSKDKILDLGTGTGRNACLMRNYFL